MKLIKKLLAIFAIIAAIGFMILPLTGCPEVPTDDETKKIPKVDPTEEESGEDPLDYIQLTEGVWKNGNIPISDGEQWFRFTATAATQYIHFDPGTMSMVYVQLYDDSKENKVGSQASLYSSSLYISRTVTSGSVYYIKVTPYNSTYSGSYQIGFTSSTTKPSLVILPTAENVITLTVNKWSDGNIATSSGEQWFKFTAIATTQYIHFSMGTLSDVNIQLYDSTGTIVGAKTNLYSSTLYTSRVVTSGSVYYIKVTPYNNSYSGAYQIGFTSSTIKPSLITLPTANVTTLIVDRWSDGNIADSNGIQWFKFTATVTGDQYIHFNPSTMTRVYIQLYDDTGATVGSNTSLYSSILYASRTVTSGSVYYIKVTPYSSTYSGAYQIAFATTSTTPNITLPTTNVTTLTVNQWSDGNIATSSGEQWFKFTATVTGNQYIHFYPGTMTRVYIQLYDNTGATVGSKEYLYDSISFSYASRTVTNGNDYYIKVTPYSSTYSGAYQITFAATSTTPNITIILPTTNITSLTANTWGSGNITTSGGEQWFTFTANTTTQYIHFSIGSLNDVNIQLYDSTGTTVGVKTNLYSSTLYTSRAVTSGNDYYIKVTPYNSNNSGNYQIMFTTSSTLPITLPTTNVTTLTSNIWGSGNITTPGGEQWFTFTANATTQYIHFSIGTLNDVNIQLYDSTGVTVGTKINLWSSTLYTSQTVTSGSVYYIKVTPYDSIKSGNYQIAFNTSSTKPQ